MAKTILLVDDSVMIRRIVGQLLKQSGFNVLGAESGEKAIELAALHHPDLVIMDIEMGGIDGIEATGRIKKDPATAAIPVIFFTSLGREEDIRRASLAGGQDFLTKPIDKETLRFAIDKILANSS